MHILLQNGSNSKQSTKNSQELKRTVKAISEIKDRKSESRNETDHSTRNLKTTKNLLTVFDFGGWTRRTDGCSWSLKTKSFRFLGREGSLRVLQTRWVFEVNENSIIYVVRIEPSGAWFHKKWPLTCQISTAAINVSEKSIYRGGKRANWKDSWWDWSKKFPHWSNNQKTWGANVYSNFHSDDVA